MTVLVSVVVGIAVVLILSFLLQNQGSGFENFLLDQIAGDLFG